MRRKQCAVRQQFSCMKFLKIIFRSLLVLILAAVIGVLGMAWWYAGYLSEPVLQPRNPAYEGQDALPKSSPGMKLTPFVFEGWDGTAVQACIAEKAENTSPEEVSQAATSAEQSAETAPANAIDYVLVAVDWDHGIRSSLALAELLTSAHLKCVLWDPRGINNARTFCSHGLRECGDVPLLITELTRREQGRELLIAAVGKGFGASMLMQATARDPRIRSFVATDLYKTLKEAVRTMLSEEVPPWLASVSFWLMEWKINSVAGYECFDVAPIEAAPSVDRSAAVLLIDSGAEPRIAGIDDALNIYSQLKTAERAIWELRPSGDIQDIGTRTVELVTGKNKKGSKHTENITVTRFAGEGTLHAEMIRWLTKHTLLPSPESALPLQASPTSAPTPELP